MTSPQTMVYTVEYNGQIYDIEGPAGAKPEELQAFLGQSAGPPPDPAATDGLDKAEPIPAGGDGEVQFNDDPGRVLTRMSPQDEDAFVRLQQTGTAEQMLVFLHQRGLASDATELSRFVAARDKGERFNYGVSYGRDRAPDQGAGAAFLNGASQGAFLGTSDELHGLVNGVSSALRGEGFSDAYNRTVDIDRAQLGADEENHWLASLSGNLVGGLALPLGLERAGFTQSTRAIGIAARDAALADGLSATAADKIAARAVAKRLAAEGAAYGGAYGAGTSEGGPGQRLLGTGVGAAGGAVAGGIVFPALTRAAGGVRRGVNATAGWLSRAVGSVTENGAKNRAGDLLRTATLRPIDDVLADIAARDAQVSGAQPTLAEVANDPGLAGFQRGFANTDPRAGAVVGERNANNALARTRYASDALGDGSPQAVQDYAARQVAVGEAETAAQQTARQTAANTRLADGRTQAQASRSEAEQAAIGGQNSIGPLVDRTATGAAQREAFEGAYDAAKRRSRTAYAAPALQDPQPIEIPASVFAGDMRAAMADHYGDGGGEIPEIVRSIIDDAAAPGATTRTLTNIDRRLADFAGKSTMAGSRSDAAFATRLRGILANFADQAAPQEYRAALRNAKAVRAEQGRVFETGDAPRTFARDRYGNPTVGDTTVPTRIVRPGAPGGDTVDGLIAAIGPDAAETAVRQELRRAVEEAGLQTEAQARSLATRFGEVAKRFPGVESDLAAVQSNARRLDAAKAAEARAARASFTPEENASIKERSAFHDVVLDSPLGNVADAAVDPSSFVAGLLRRSDDGRRLRYLAQQIGDNPDALGGMRRALGDYIETAGAGPSFTQAGERVPSITKTRQAITAVVKRSGNALTNQQKAVLSTIARELTSANFAVTAGRPSGSDTAMNRSLARMINAVPAGVHGAPVKTILSKVVSAMSNEDHVKQLLTQAILEPDFAAVLLKRPTARNMLDVQRRYAGRKGTIFAGQATTASSEQYRTGTR
ncbi:hypothetical protein ASE75_13705 [Sphingomonas sp. Leaf17]|uniref:hypothetical protein n=1 Tax=Sphingomonas sp. Leaf17 TaxID=1735683 RepID=UPI0006F53046|nr:hypothetical protein [Sphingomonas sp. Leaf17]KQM62680.1 hypothetical protein ASE75_13705 [Sphingomonas sp. Leaf17]